METTLNMRASKYVKTPSSLKETYIIKNTSYMKTNSNWKTISNKPNQTYQTEAAKQNLRQQTH